MFRGCAEQKVHNALTEPFGVLDFGSVGIQDGPIRVSNRWSLGLHRWSTELSELRPFVLLQKMSAGERESRFRGKKSCREKQRPKASAGWLTESEGQEMTNWASVFAILRCGFEGCLSAASTKQPRE